MSGSIELLEEMGKHGDRLSTVEREARAVALPPALREALRSGSRDALSRLLGAREWMACAIFAPEPEEQPVPDEQGDVPTDEPDESESRAA